MQRQGFSAPSVCCVEVLQLFDPNPVRYTFCHILVNECRFHIFFYSVSSHIKLVWFIHCILSLRPLLVYTLLVYQTISSSNIKLNVNVLGGFYVKNAQYIVPVTFVRQYWLFFVVFFKY